MKSIDARKILESLESDEDRFNERLLRLICITQAISKLSKELSILEEAKNELLGSL